MVEKFGYSASQVTLLFLVNYIFNWFFAERIGKLINIFGEKKCLIFEYIGLIVVFTSYAFVTNAYVAAGLYIIDHMFFALAIAINTYFQKIADPKDIASTAGVSFTIIFLLFYFKEQNFAIFSLALTGLGVAITGFLPTVYDL